MAHIDMVTALLNGEYHPDIIIEVKMGRLVELLQVAYQDGAAANPQLDYPTIVNTVIRKMG